MTFTKNKQDFSEKGPRCLDKNRGTIIKGCNLYKSKEVKIGKSLVVSSLCYTNRNDMLC